MHQDVHPHMLRHTFGTALADCGVPVERIREHQYLIRVLEREAGVEVAEDQIIVVSAVGRIGRQPVGEHFGGQVGPDQFSAPEAVIHQDHVFLPELQPRVAPALVTLELEDGERMDLMRDGRYVVGFGEGVTDDT